MLGRLVISYTERVGGLRVCAVAAASDCLLPEVSQVCVEENQLTCENPAVFSFPCMITTLVVGVTRVERTWLPHLHIGLPHKAYISCESVPG